MREKDRKFKFRFIVVTDNFTFVDQQVHSYTFINIGTAKAVINNAYILDAYPIFGPLNYHNNTYIEPLLSGEKTAQEYKLIFDPLSISTERSVQVIMKIEVLDGK